MKLITYLTFCFMAYELLKLCMLPTYWNAATKRDKDLWMIIIEILYLLFMVVLMFVGYWYIGVAILIVSTITAFQIMDFVMDRSKFTKQIRSYLFADGVVSILMLSILILKEFQII
jgi:hypothetical protein